MWCRRSPSVDDPDDAGSNGLTIKLSSYDSGSGKIVNDDYEKDLFRVS